MFPNERFMTKEELVIYWLDSADIDYQAMESLYEKGNFIWALFVGHLVIEKILKAHYINNTGGTPPQVHNLLKIAEDAHIDLAEEQKDYLLEITTFNIKARYPDYKFKFYKKADREFTARHIALIKELRQWLLKKIKK